MLIHPHIDPIALQLGPLAIRWYGLMYLLGFVAFLMLARYRLKRRSDIDFTTSQVDDFAFFAILGVLLGGRLGYILFYKPAFYLQNPLEILKVWEGGMSFHGGFLGVLLVVWLWARRNGKPWLAVTDFIAPLLPVGLGAGRIGNFINGELFGRATELPWGMVFRYPGAGDVARHPSQLYQFFLEGVLLFAILWLYSAKPRPLGRVSALFLIGYGVFRFAVEFTREPDEFLGLLALGLSMGQWLSLPMLLIGLWLWRHSGRRAA